MDADELLAHLAKARAADPLRPSTVIAPSHATALQLRRRLAEIGPFAAVRFEPLARIAELLAAGVLAAEGRSPLARPIGDYIAQQVARESQGTFAAIADLAGYARILRQLFRRLRRGGIENPDQASGAWQGHFREVLRLFGLFRGRSAAFYDEEDLLDAAARVVRSGSATLLDELGDIFVLQPAALSAGADALVEALRETGRCVVVDEADQPAQSHFVLAPDPASEVREAVREVLVAIEGGTALHEVAILHGADPSYGRMLREAMDVAVIPATVLPGPPLMETVAGRGLLGLLALPDLEYSRTATMDTLAIAPLRHEIPAGEGEALAARVTAWDRISRQAGVTRGIDAWHSGLSAFGRSLEARIADLKDEDASSRPAMQFQRDEATRLAGVMDELHRRLEPLRASQPAAPFIVAVRQIARDYLEAGSAEVEAVLNEVDQLGTVSAVGGTFALSDFVRALRANLEAAHVRERRFGDGVLVADYRVAAGLSFRHVIICGAREGVFPAGPGDDALVEDAVWAQLRMHHRFIEDAALRSSRAADAARRAIASARGGTLTWCAPMYETSGTREYYPSPLMVEAAAAHDASVRTGNGLRRHGAAGWLRRGSSPLALRLGGSVIDLAELRLREAIIARRERRHLDPSHPRARAVEMLRARASNRFTEWDGNLGALKDDPWLVPGDTVSPTALESYGACGFRYLCRSLLRLNVTEEPEERETMDSAARGTLVHAVLEAFFREQIARGRPRAGESWTAADRDRVFALLDDALDDAGQRGAMGLDIFAAHQLRTLRSDLEEFLDADNVFRLSTGSVPAAVEEPIPENEVAGVRLRGYVDRIDRTPDGQQAWVIDYKTGSRKDYEHLADDPLARGTRLQLPAYLLAVEDSPEAFAFYWFISRGGGFERIEYQRTPAHQTAFEETIGAIVGGIRAGAFPAVPGDDDEFFGSFQNCKYCDFDRICARRRDDAFGEKRGDEAVDAWLAVERAAGGAP